MAEERTVKAPTATAKAAPPAKAAGADAGNVKQLRTDLSAARRDLALQKLDSPAKIRKLRKDLARALTAERAKATPPKVKEAA